VLTLALGGSWRDGVFTGFLIALSSTAIVLKLLRDQGETSSVRGRLSVAVLIAQDLGVVGMVLVVPLLGPGGEGESGTGSLVGAVLTAVAATVLLVARRVVRAVLDVVARTCSPKVFLLTIVAVCFGTAYLIALAGASVSLRAFLAGLVVSASRASTHALADVLPAAAASQGERQAGRRDLTNTLEDRLRTNIDGVRTLLLDVTLPTASAWWSVSLLVAGLGLQTLANVIQAMGPAVGS